MIKFQQRQVLIYCIKIKQNFCAKSEGRNDTKTIPDISRISQINFIYREI